VWRAARRLGISAREAAAPAVAAGLIEFGTQVQFRHPLARSAAYRSASLSGRQQLHAVLAEMTDPVAEPDRRAWHRAQTAAGPDEEVAAELERCAGRAQARGGLAAAAAFLERSVALTIDVARHAERILAAAQANLQAGEFDKALELLATAEAGPLDDFQRAIYTRQVRLVRDAGALEQLPIHLSALSLAQAWSGDFAEAAALIAESDRVAAATGNRFPPYVALRLLALQGREAEAAAMASAIEQAAPELEVAATTVHWATAVLYNGLARYGEAAVSARRAAADTFAPWLSMWALPELAEAAARNGNAALARDALERLAATTRPCGTDWALGIEARCRALLSDGQYGEWLRREGRRVDARDQLRAAHDMLAAIGMQAFAERALRELLATGETVRRRNAETITALTAQEAQIARLARDGRTNPEIGAQLFLSARTVEWHLRKIFTKLGIASRRELHVALAQFEHDGEPG
jgi:DNA-binding CsgD family transcriptional regulator/tetratricopeptide (TPR) repeat protein